MQQVTAADDALLTTYGRLLEAFSSLGRQIGPSLEQRAGLLQTWFEVLLRVSRADGAQVAMGALAEQVALTSGGISKLVDRMVEAGLLQRVPCASDRRVSYAALTPEGARRLAQATQVHAADLRQVFSGFTRQDLRTLDGLLDRLRSARLD